MQMNPDDSFRDPESNKEISIGRLDILNNVRLLRYVDTVQKLSSMLVRLAPQ